MMAKMAKITENNRPKIILCVIVVLYLKHRK